ncbi:MAG TPA: N-acetylmuramoyl-L-alanine amidase [Clostridiales bacterium]|nr:MAG: hypothetical protein A2Y18_05755 [Clostridiales bacterium GWD2_32_19]HCC06775.1 N-acetylmuramoyl-L-alanine amidase [Clostridiales bacterium]
MFKINKENLLILVLLILLVLEIINSDDHKSKSTFTHGLPLSNKVIVIDAGHGGKDEGTSGKLEKTEKVINLEVAIKLQKYLEQSGAFVILTRADGMGLHDLTARNKKMSDLAKRKDIINNSYADIMLSIHQNNFSESKYSGSQVFYSSNCEASKNLAKHIQTQMKEVLDKKNDRVEKENKEYYLFKKSKIPNVLIECGFLSNPIEEMKLNDTEYQENVAWAIYKGVLLYYNN